MFYKDLNKMQKSKTKILIFQPEKKKLHSNVKQLKFFKQKPIFFLFFDSQSTMIKTF